MVVKMDQNGVVKMNLGRKPEAIDYLERFMERGEKDTERYPNGGVGTFGRPTDVAWDSQDNIYISDGYTNSRFVKLSKDGSWVKAIGTHGSGPDQFSTPHGIASDGTLVYVADRGNNRIQIYDGASMTFKTSYTGVGAPWSVQVTQRYVYSGDGTGKIYRLDKASGKLLGWIQTGMGQGQTGCIIHELHAVSDNVLIKGSCSEWKRREDYVQRQQRDAVVQRQIVTTRGRTDFSVRPRVFVLRTSDFVLQTFRPQTASPTPSIALAPTSTVRAARRRPRAASPARSADRPATDR